MFADDILVIEKSPQVFEGTVAGNWSVNGNSTANFCEPGAGFLGAHY